MSTTCRQIFCISSIFLMIFFVTKLFGQTNLLYNNLPVGKYAVGFKIITLTDDTRISKPGYNYLGEKNVGDLSRKITIHLWYPAKDNSTKRQLSFEDYCYNDLLTSTNENVIDAEKNSQVSRKRTSMEGWFGKTTDDVWKKLITNPMLAKAEAVAVNEKFPLLIGMLRPLSTSITNELMASNGYLVAMVRDEDFPSFSDAALSQIPDMQFSVNYLKNQTDVDITKIGVFGFSGSGFIPVLFGMFDYRIKALADIESGIYMEGLFQGLSASNYYDPSKLRIPFLHIFSRDLSRQEKYIDEFEKKAKFSKRYRLILNQPALHHWDVATEGRASTTVLHVRGDKEPGIKASFELSNIYLLHFFNAALKKSTSSQKIIDTKTSIAGHHDSLWSIQQYPALKPPPDKAQFEELINRKGINEAIRLAREYQRLDSAADFIHQNVLINLDGNITRRLNLQKGLR